MSVFFHTVSWFFLGRGHGPSQGQQPFTLTVTITVEADDSCDSGGESTDVELLSVVAAEILPPSLSAGEQTIVVVDWRLLLRPRLWSPGVLLLFCGLLCGCRTKSS